MSAADIPPPPEVLGPPRYSILRPLVEGGMGELLLGKYEGREGFVRTVVLKGILPRPEPTSATLEMLLREGRWLAKLEHPNVVRALDIAVIDARHFLVLEFVRGQDCRQVIRRGRALQRPCPLSLALYIVSRALIGLHYAHGLCDDEGRRLGLVHRDITPSNVLLGVYGEVKIADFGIARVTEMSRNTVAGHVRGKARYLAPEQVRGDPGSVASDIHSAGALLGELISGTSAFPGGSLTDTLNRVLKEDRRVTADRILNEHPGHPELSVILQRALAIRPDDRFGTALDFAEALQVVLRRRWPATNELQLVGYLEELRGLKRFGVEDDEETLAVSRDGSGLDPVPAQAQPQLRARPPPVPAELLPLLEAPPRVIPQAKRDSIPLAELLPHHEVRRPPTLTTLLAGVLALLLLLWLLQR